MQRSEGKGNKDSAGNCEQIMCGREYEVSVGRREGGEVARTYHKGIPLSQFHFSSREFHLTNISKGMATINSHMNPD